MNAILLRAHISKQHISTKATAATVNNCSNNARNDNTNASKSNNKKIKPVQDQVWICGECEKAFGSEKACVKHQASTGHTNPMCRECGKTFLNDEGLRQHCDATKHISGRLVNNTSLEPLGEDRGCGLKTRSLLVGDRRVVLIDRNDRRTAVLDDVVREFNGIVDFSDCVTISDFNRAVTSSPLVAEVAVWQDSKVRYLQLAHNKIPGSTNCLAVHQSDLQAMPVSSMRNLFGGFVDFDGCLEKRDMVEAVKSSPNVIFQPNAVHKTSGVTIGTF